MLSLSCPAARIVSVRRSFNLNSAVKNAKLLVMSHCCLIYPSMRPHEPPTGISTGCDSPMLRRQNASSCLRKSDQFSVPHANGQDARCPSFAVPNFATMPNNTRRRYDLARFCLSLRNYVSKNTRNCHAEAKIYGIISHRKKKYRASQGE